MNTRNGTDLARKIQIGKAATNQITASHPLSFRMNRGSSCTDAHRDLITPVARGHTMPVAPWHDLGMRTLPRPPWTAPDQNRAVEAQRCPAASPTDAR